MRPSKLALLATTMITSLLTLLPATAARADMVVIKASGPGVTLGQVVPVGAALTLPANSRATLVASDGRSVSLKGPFSGVVEEAKAAGGEHKTISTLAALLAANGTDSSSLLALRDGSSQRSPYSIDPEAKVHCQVSFEQPVLERDMGSSKDNLTISAATGAKASLVWPDFETTLNWPKSVPLQDGDYVIRLASMSVPLPLIVHAVPADVKGLPAIAAWMSEHGCAKQAIRVLTGIR